MNQGTSGQAFRLSAMMSSPTTPSVAVPSSSAAAGPTPGPLTAIAVLGLAAAFAWKKLRRTGSLTGLEDRGYLDQNRGRKDALGDVMKSVNTVPLPSLSDEQIMAARARRQKERANHKIDLEDIELPDNHPWATKAATQQDGERVRARILPRRAPVDEGAPGAGASPLTRAQPRIPYTADEHTAGATPVTQQPPVQPVAGSQ